MSVIYIAGPMTGYQDFNRDAFESAKLDLIQLGYSVINPATLPDGLTQQQYMAICLQMLMAADEVYMLNGWRKSSGAVAEHALATKLGMKIHEQKNKAEGWISVKDRLPEKGVRALVFRPKASIGGDPEITISRISEDRSLGWQCNWEPSHWMPLPEAPDEAE